MLLKSPLVRIAASAGMILLFAATIPSANWLIGNVGTECVPNGPCLIPVGFGLMAPSGVLLIGLALVLRDWVHEHMDIGGALLAIAVGGIASFFTATPALAAASTAAFLLAEMADTLVYAPLRKNRLFLAVAASGAVGAVIDSAVFLWLAFGSLDYIVGQVVGKFWMSALAAVVLIAVDARRKRAF
jgi:queuosine precursor transporter